MAEDQEDFPAARFLIRKGERDLVDELMATVKAAEKLSQKGIRYLPSALLYGVSGSGKTMLARYIAHKAGKPFVYMQFSNTVSSLLGSTQSNIGKIFDYARTCPCVLCLDEIDAIGMARGQQQEVGEMDRIVIALMQEMDLMPNDVMLSFYFDLSGVASGPAVNRNTVKRAEDAVSALSIPLHEMEELYLDTIRQDTVPKPIMSPWDSLFIFEMCLGGRIDDADETVERFARCAVM